MNKTLSDLDILIKKYGVKYVYILGDRQSVEEKLEDAGDDPNDYPTATFWCELSWGHGDDKYEFAHNNVGDTLGEAIQNCLNAFTKYVREGVEDRVDAALDAGININKEPFI